MNTIHKTRSYLEEKKRQIEHRLSKLDTITAERDRKLYIRRTIIVGSLAMQAAKESAEHRQWLISLLSSSTLMPRDANVIEAFVGELTQSTTPEDNRS